MHGEGNVYGQLGNGTKVNSNVPVKVFGISDAIDIDVSNSGDSSCPVLEDHSIKCWGGNNFGQLGTEPRINESPVPVPVFGVDGATAISASIYSTCARLQDATDQCWGSFIDRP